MTKKHSQHVATCSIPTYCVKVLGSRHFLIGGGGGSARTGVRNELQLYLMTYGSQFNFDLGRLEPASLIAQLNSSVDTAEFANMNMDCIALDNRPETGRFLIAAGQDQFCALYWTDGFCLNECEHLPAADRLLAPSILAFAFRGMVRLETDKRSGDDSYQKCVKLFRRPESKNIQMLTAGTDGHVRLWSLSKLIESVDPAQLDNGMVLNLVEILPDTEIPTGKGIVEDMDVSKCGNILGTVLPHETVLWDLNSGDRILSLPINEAAKDGPMCKRFKVRSIRFTALDKTAKNVVFVTVHNQRVRSRTEVSFLALWMYAKGDCRLIRWRKAYKESISCLEVSECDQFVAFGTMGGSVGIVDTRSLGQLLLLPEAHSSFVTSLAFLPQNTYDMKNVGRIGGDRQMANGPTGLCFLPGVCAESRVSLVSISVDQRILVHQLPFSAPISFTGSLLRLSLLAVFIYFSIWSIFLPNNPQLD